MSPGGLTVTSMSFRSGSYDDHPRTPIGRGKTTDTVDGFRRLAPRGDDQPSRAGAGPRLHVGFGRIRHERERWMSSMPPPCRLAHLRQLRDRSGERPRVVDHADPAVAVLDDAAKAPRWLSPPTWIGMAAAPASVRTSPRRTRRSDRDARRPVRSTAGGTRRLLRRYARRGWRSRDPRRPTPPSASSRRCRIRRARWTPCRASPPRAPKRMDGAGRCCTRVCRGGCVRSPRRSTPASRTGRMSVCGGRSSHARAPSTSDEAMSTGNIRCSGIHTDS